MLRLRRLLKCSAPSWWQVLLLAASLRLAWTVVVPVIPVSDSARYDFYAQQLAAGLGYSEEGGGPAVYWPVGPSFLYSLAYRVLGHHHEGRYYGVSILNLLLGVATVGFTGLLATRWFGSRTGAITGLVMACWPTLIMFTTVLSSELPMLFFMTAALVCWTTERSPLWFRALGTGVLLAGASYMRPTALLLPMVFAVQRLVVQPRRLRTLGATGLAVVAMLAAILPWSLRNYSHFGEVVVISANGGVNFWMGNNPETTGFYQREPNRPFNDAIDRDKRLKREALEYVFAEPGLFARRTVVKMLRLHERESIGVVWNAEAIAQRVSSQALIMLKLLANGYWWACLCASMLALLTVVPRAGFVRCAIHPVTMIWVYFTVVHGVTVIQDRYHLAFVPCVACAVGIGAVALPWVGRTLQTGRSGGKRTAEGSRG